MEIHSIAYFIFCLGLLIPFYFFSFSQRKILLLIASYFFYGSYSTVLLGALVLSTMVNYALVKKQISNWILVGFNIGFLLSFKLAGLFENNTIFVSIGISFFTFQAMSYGIDRRKNIPHSFLDFANYLSFFPQLIAGPIESFNELTIQLQKPKFPTLEMFKNGVLLISIGLAKKLIIADRAAMIVDHVYGNLDDSNFISLCLAAVLYTFQIFLDFSAYCDIALGVGGCFGIQLSRNFNQPYFSKSISEFWRRWHITLHVWMKKNIFSKLILKNGWFVSTSLVFLISGAWHGIKLHFLLWALFSLTTLLFDRFIIQKLRFPNVIKVFITFFLVTTGWILFRLETLNDLSLFVQHFQNFKIDFITQPLSELYYIITHPSESIWYGTFSIGKQHLPISSIDFIILLFSLVTWGLVSCFYSRGKELTSKLLATVLLLMMIGFLGFNNSQPFIYLQF